MRKMSCLFENAYGTQLATPTMRPECAWVLESGVIATRKWDGTACAVIGGILYGRFDAKRSPPPPGSIRCAPELLEGQHGCHVHWAPVTDASQWKWHLEAWTRPGPALLDGTYELIGPRVNSNHEHVDSHQFRRHGDVIYPDAPRGFDALKEYLSRLNAEGIVFHHPDGARMCKLRRRDFGFPWPVPQ